MKTQREFFATAVDIRRWLEADAGTGEETRIRRDRLIGRELGAVDCGKAERVLAWWAMLNKQKTGALPADASSQVSLEINATGPSSDGDRLASLVSIANGLLAVGGLVAGVVIATAAFAYQGNHPVNLFALFGILIGVPLVLLVMQLVLLGHRLPLPAAMGDALRVLSPALWAGSWLERRMPSGLFASVGHASLRGSYARWQLIAFSQSFAIGYFIGVLVLAGLLVVFTDLAFGWSTTLNLDPCWVWQVLSGLAMPWTFFLPAAVPDLALVEASRYFRLEGSALAASRAAELGRWWPFVLMTILVYGLLPRCLVAGVAGRQLRRAVRRLLEEGPEITALLDRLRGPAVDFDAGDPEEPVLQDRRAAEMPVLDIDERTAVIVWNNAVEAAQYPEFWSRRNLPVPARHDAAEWLDMEAMLTSIRTARPGRVLILAKGWEPPLLSFLDFLTAVRNSIGPEASIAVVPLNAARTGVDSSSQVVWSRAIAQLPDPALYVAGATS